MAAATARPLHLGKVALNEVQLSDLQKPFNPRHLIEYVEKVYAADLVRIVMRGRSGQSACGSVTKPFRAG